jgi:large subunit ribosomal protein L10
MPETYTTKVKPEKVAVVEKIRAELDESSAAVITEYRGLTVENLKDLRSRLIETETSYRVSKNTLARLAVNALGYTELEDLFEGPVAIAYVKGDPIAAAKVIATFAKEHPALLIKGGVLEGKVLSSDETKGLATVDPLDVSRAKIAGMLTAPLQQLMMLLEAPTARILFVLDEIAKRPSAEVAPGSSAEAAPEATSEAAEGQEAEPTAEAEPVAEVAPEAEATTETTTEEGETDAQG